MELTDAALQDKANIKDAILSMYGLPSSGEYILQVFDVDFQDWVDVDDPAALPDVGKLKLTICTGI